MYKVKSKKYHVNNELKCNSRFKGQPFYQLHKNYPIPMYFGPTFRKQMA